MEKISFAISFNLGTLTLTAAVPAQVIDTEKGKQLMEKGACAVCHGVGPNAPVSPDHLKFVGQHGDYIYHALLAYQTSNNPLVGRSSAITAGQVNSDPATIGADDKSRPLIQAELEDIVACIESLLGSLVLKK